MRRSCAPTLQLASNKAVKTLETLVGDLREGPIGSPNLSRGIFDDIEHGIGALLDGHDLAEAFGR